MKNICMSIVLMLLAMLSEPGHATVKPASCTNGWPVNSSVFETKIEYDDLQSKANPTVHVTINGKPAKMVLDTGASVNFIWDSSFFDSDVDGNSYEVHSHVASTQAKVVKGLVSDDHGRALHRDFFLVDRSILAAYGYAGLLSPQAIAGDDAVLIDFDQDCFFTSQTFDIQSDERFNVRTGGVIENV